MSYFIFLISINFLFLLLCSVNDAKTLYEGDQCISHTGKNGKCTTVKSCATAYELVKNNTNNYFVICGYSGFQQIVCCVDDIKSKTDTDEPDKNVGNNRKAAQVCKSYNKQFPVITTVHIIGGEVTSPGEFPHMVALGYRSERTIDFSCGGSLISKRYVLTAAHCIKRSERPQVARMGTIDLSTSNKHFEDYKIEDFKIHPKYVRSEKYNDIGLLRLAKDVNFTTEIIPACLYTELTDPAETLVATGWGITNVRKNIRSSKLMSVGLEPFALDNCNNTYLQIKAESIPHGIINTQLCTYDPRGEKDACQGDSGGPLILKKSTGSTYTIVGITSFAENCGVKPGVYTRVSSYLDWIEPIVWPN